jgi:acyl carrier protein
MTIEELLAEFQEFMEIDNPPKLEEELESYDDWDSMVTLSVLALFEDEFGINAAEALAKCTTFQDVANIVSKELSPA